MKKILWSLFMLILSIISGILVSCQSNNLIESPSETTKELTTHSHEITDNCIIIKEPTCLESGL